MLVRASREAGNWTASEVRQQRIATPVVLQMHASECGAACLGSVLGHFGRWVPLTELREKCEVSRDGSSAASILRASRQYGLECSGLSLRADQLRKLQLPLILFWQFTAISLFWKGSTNTATTSMIRLRATPGILRGVCRRLQRCCPAVCTW